MLSFSKFGNLNFGLGFADALPSGPCDFVAILGIDMIPLPYWLRAALPYMVADSKVGLANPRSASTIFRTKTFPCKA